MPPGKAASQAGHAFLDSYSKAPIPLAARYHAGGMGTKVVLVAPGEEQLRAIHALAKSAKLPCAIIVDSGHIMPPHFTGAPVVTAVGIGPATRDQVKHITEGLQLMP